MSAESIRGYCKRCAAAVSLPTEDVPADFWCLRCGVFTEFVSYERKL